MYEKHNSVIKAMCREWYSSGSATIIVFWCYKNKRKKEGKTFIYPPQMTPHKKNK